MAERIADLLNRLDLWTLYCWVGAFVCFVGRRARIFPQRISISDVAMLGGLAVMGVALTEQEYEALVGAPSLASAALGAPSPMRRY